MTYWGEKADTSGNIYAEREQTRGQGGDASLKINQFGIHKDICKTLAEKHIREKS